MAERTADCTLSAQGRRSFDLYTDFCKHDFIFLHFTFKKVVDQTLYVWIKHFLTNRTQAVRVSSSLSPWRHTHGGVPQGTKHGFTLFATMINRLLGDWHSRLKYVDDTTVFA